MSKLASVAFALLALASVARAGSTVLRVSNVVSTRYPVIDLSLNVLDAAGEAVSGVGPGEVSLEEGGRRIVPTAVAVQKTPLRVAVVVDRSARIRSIAAQLDAAVLEIFDHLETADRAALVGFSDTAKVVQGLTSDHAQLKAALQRARSGAGAAMRDGIVEAARELAGSGPRATILLITAGPDRNGPGTGAQSSASLRAAAKAAHDLQIPVWIVGVGASASEPLFAKLAAVTGGQSCPAGGADQVGRCAGRVLADLRKQYLVSYRTPLDRGAGGARPLTVSCTHGEAATVKIRYTVPPPPAAPEAVPGVIDVEPERVGPGPDMDPMQ